MDAVTDGIDAQARVAVSVENVDTGTIFNAAGIDFDVMKAEDYRLCQCKRSSSKRECGRLVKVFLSVMFQADKWIRKEDKMKKIVTLAGDGIGPEIMSAGLEVLNVVAQKVGFEYETQAKAFGGAE